MEIGKLFLLLSLSNCPYSSESLDNIHIKYPFTDRKQQLIMLIIINCSKRASLSLHYFGVKIFSANLQIEQTVRALSLSKCNHIIGITSVEE